DPAEMMLRLRAVPSTKGGTVAKKKAPDEEIRAEAQEEEAAIVDASDPAEVAACTPVPVRREKFNEHAVIPYGLTIEHIYQAMNEFTSFIGFINTQLNTKGIQRFEAMLMPANFSSMVGEFMTATIPK